MTIRAAHVEDAPAIAPLISQLGYPTSPQQMRVRLSSLDDANHFAIVAEVNNRIVGFLGARLDLGFEYDGLQARILALVVDENTRGKGIGRALVAEAEKWARSCGAHKIMVNTAHRRTQTHEFYKSVGFESTGLRFVRSLDK